MARRCVSVEPEAHAIAEWMFGRRTARYTAALLPTPADHGIGALASGKCHLLDRHGETRQLANPP